MKYRSLLLSSLLPLLIDQASGALCKLCKKSVLGISWPLAIIDSSGKTCNEKAVDMAMLNDSDQCKAEIKQFRTTCCNGRIPPTDVQTVPPTLPPTSGVTGGFSKCDLCRDGQGPGEQNTVINMLYIGAQTCDEFWISGQNGLIPDYLCVTLQKEADIPCVCGVFDEDPDNIQAPAPEVVEDPDNNQAPFAGNEAPAPEVVEDPDNNQAPFAGNQAPVPEVVEDPDNNQAPFAGNQASVFNVVVTTSTAVPEVVVTKSAESTESPGGIDGATQKDPAYPHAKDGQKEGYKEGYTTGHGGVGGGFRLLRGAALKGAR